MITITRQRWAALLACTSTDEGRPHLCAFQVSQDHLVATDGSRLITVPHGGEHPTGVYQLPKKRPTRGCKQVTLDDGGLCYLDGSGKVLHECILRPSTEVYPHWERIVPAATPDWKLTDQDLPEPCRFNPRLVAEVAIALESDWCDMRQVGDPGSVMHVRFASRNGTNVQAGESYDDITCLVMPCR